MSKIISENLNQFELENRCWQGIPSIDTDTSGTLYASWYSGGAGEGTENFVLMHKSTDNGKSFSSPVSVVSPEGDIRAYDPAVFADPNGTIRWFWAESYGMFDGQCGVWQSILGSGGFEKPTRICDGIMMNKPTVLKNGGWLHPVSIWSMDPYFKKAGDTVKTQSRPSPGAYAVISRDLGNTYHILGKAIPDERSCDEHMIIEKNDGTLWMLIRVKYGIAESFSYDGGAIWSPAKPSAIKSPTSRFFIRRMPSGRLLLINHLDFTDDSNLHVRRNNLTAMLSDDDGKTWPHRLLLDERIMVSYPDAAIRPDGEIIVIYDRDRYGSSEILTARITEKEILNGMLSEPDSYLKNVISSRK